MMQELLNYPQALEAITKGQKVTRESWMNPNAFIKSIDLHAADSPFILKEENSKLVFPPFLALHSMSGTKDRWVPWTGTQIDQLATDWKIAL